MTSISRVAVVQMSSTEEKESNLRAAIEAVECAAAAGARLIALPELFTCYGRAEKILAAAETIPGPTSELLAALVRRLSITLVAGSVCERSADPARGYNTSLLYLPDGSIAARYRKQHLFDLELADKISCRESSWLIAGDATCATETPIGCVGQAICYDLRFPEGFAALAAVPCDVLCVPSAFMQATGRDHWEVLLRARALECQAFVLAPNQVGRHAPGLTTYGHSMIVDPWGTVLAEASDGPEIIFADVDLARIAAVRASLPVLAERTRARRGAAH